MEYTWLYAILSALLVSLIAFAGVLFLSFRIEKLQKIIFILVSFAVGGLLGNAFFHLLPEAYEQIGNPLTVAVLLMSGLLMMFVLEKFFHWQHHHDLQPAHNEIKSLGYISLVADGFHNFVDGILIASAWMVSPEIGIATTLAVIIHEIPQEISDFGILIHAGFSKTKALLANFLAACTSVLGAVITLLVGNYIQNLSLYILPFAAGGFIYLAASDLIPELHKDHSRKNSFIQLAVIIAGLALMYIISMDHNHVHGHDHIH
jgi:zinc and cadmium transporter